MGEQTSMHKREKGIVEEREKESWKGEERESLVCVRSSSRMYMRLVREAEWERDGIPEALSFNQIHYWKFIAPPRIN